MLRRPLTFWKKGTLVINKYSHSLDYGVTTSVVEYYTPRGSGVVTEYVWVLWGNGEHCLFKVDMLEEVSESR